MDEALGDDEIALLCDLGEFDPVKASEAQKRGLERLLAGGYVEASGAAFRPTAKGIDFLGARGAGLNEA